MCLGISREGLVVKKVYVDLGSRSYDILIEAGLTNQLSSFFDERELRKRIFLVSNDSIFKLIGKKILDNLQGNGYEVSEILIPDGEKYKNLETVENIYGCLVDQKADRTSILAALGGGVIGDITGFAAATFLRGISYVQIPTTLLAQVDSSVGGKTGVNYGGGKNMIGSFCQPHLVCIDPESLSTLPQREFQSGLYEVVKYGLIYDQQFSKLIHNSLENIQNMDPVVLESIIGRCCEIKAEITSNDETETDLRRILNFGHTFGHALEAAAKFQGITHGEAVGYGMIAATNLSVVEGHLDSDVANSIIRKILQVGPLPPIQMFPTENILGAMSRDKKRLGMQNFFVLLKEVGKTIVIGNVSEKVLAEVWEETKRVGNSFPL